MQCNIDSKGKAVRLKGGIAVLVLSLILLILYFVLNIPWIIYVGIGFFLGGSFMIFEARKGWCVIRALGFKTPI